MSCDFVVSRSIEPIGAWKVTYCGRWLAAFRRFDDALVAARRWAVARYSGPAGAETRVFIERTRGRLEADAHFGIVTPDPAADFIGASATASPPVDRRTAATA